MNNREIKFRVWEIHNNKFSTYPYGFSLNKNFELSIPDDSFDGVVKKYVYQQFTGFKDQKSKEIYEGDIISDKGINVLVEFYKGCFGAKFIDEKYCDKRKIYCHHFHPFYFDAAFLEKNCKILNFEIVGNIFENPELLKHE